MLKFFIFCRLAVVISQVTSNPSLDSIVADHYLEIKANGEMTNTSGRGEEDTDLKHTSHWKPGTVNVKLLLDSKPFQWMNHRLDKSSRETKNIPSNPPDYRDMGNHLIYRRSLAVGKISFLLPRMFQANSTWPIQSGYERKSMVPSVHHMKAQGSGQDLNSNSTATSPTLSSPTSMATSTYRISGTPQDPVQMCQGSPRAVLPHPSHCAMYINCSSEPDAVMMTFHQSYVMECPYPQLFSDVTLQCENFPEVICDKRWEPKSPCEYRENRCLASSHCIPCWVRYASCRGLDDGLHPWADLRWRPEFMDCHKERTLFQGTCRPGAVFSPVTRACETPRSIPSKYGGRRPGCVGRRNGFYPDEFGNCALYYRCRAQLFRGFHICKNGLQFNPLTSKCESSQSVPYPCGDLDVDQTLCQTKDDGSYMDVFGRCTHFFTCSSHNVSEAQVCGSGIFNVYTRQCDSSLKQRLRVPRPCGERRNVCLHQADGEYRARHGKRVVCERGLLIAVKPPAALDTRGVKHSEEL